MSAPFRRRAAQWLLAALLLAALLLLAAALLRPREPGPRAPDTSPAKPTTPPPSATSEPSATPPSASSEPSPSTPPTVSAPSAAAASGPRPRRPIPEAELQRVVVAGAGALKPACWEKAQAAGGSAVTSARVLLAFTVGPAGMITRARATGGEAFSSLDGCVELVARGWKFPTGYDETSSQAEFRFRTE